MSLRYKFQDTLEDQLSKLDIEDADMVAEQICDNLDANGFFDNIIDVSEESND